MLAACGSTGPLMYINDKSGLVPVAIAGQSWESPMSTFSRRFSLVAGAFAMVGLVFASNASLAETGNIRLKVTKVGFIVGVGGGNGVLHFRGKNYKLTIGGVSAGTIGVAGADLVGTAKNLHKASDIAGVYSAASASVAVAGGGKVVTLQNSNGVVLTLHGQQVGFEASLSLSGMTLSLE
jgi:hypothetical protein